MDPNFQVRQGDVFVKAATAVPDRAQLVERDNGKIVLAYGEVTGHSHAIAAPEVTMFVDPETGRRWLIVNDDAATVLDGQTVAGVALEHEEHSTVVIPPGVHEVVGQREYTAEAIRRVAD